MTRLNQLLDPQRFQRLIEASVFHPREAYGPLELLNDVQAALWSELDRAAPIDTYRRNLQRGYIERLAFLMNEEITVSNSPLDWSTPVDVSQSDIRPMARGKLKGLRTRAERAARQTQDEMTRYHLEDVLVRIDDILEGEDPR